MGLYSVAWTGAGGSNWNALGNFVQMGGMGQLRQVRASYVVVVFSDSATLTSVTLNSGNVLPSSVTFQNNLSDLYAFRDGLDCRQHRPEPDQRRHADHREHQHVYGADLDRAGGHAAIGQRPVLTAICPTVRFRTAGGRSIA